MMCLMIWHPLSTEYLEGWCEQRLGIHMEVPRIDLSAIGLHVRRDSKRIRDVDEAFTVLERRAQEHANGHMTQGNSNYPPLRVMHLNFPFITLQS